MKPISENASPADPAASTGHGLCRFPPSPITIATRLWSPGIHSLAERKRRERTACLVYHLRNLPRDEPPDLLTLSGSITHILAQDPKSQSIRPTYGLLRILRTYFTHKDTQTWATTHSSQKKRLLADKIGPMSLAVTLDPT